MLNKFTSPEEFPYYKEIRKILDSKSKTMPDKLDDFLKQNPSANQVFLFNQTPYACMYLSKKFNNLSLGKKQLAAQTARIFLKYELPLFVPVTKINKYQNFLDFVVGRGDLEFTKMLAPDILEKMHQEKPQHWLEEVQKIINMHLPKKTIAKNSGCIEYLQIYLEKFKLEKIREKMETEDFTSSKRTKINKL